MRATALTVFTMLGCTFTPFVCSQAAAAEEPYSIGRWGNSLLVTAPASTNMDRRTNAKLTERMTLDFQDAPLTDVIDFIRVATRINIIVAPSVLVQTPNITLKASNMSLGNVLHWVTKLSKTNMGFIHGALFISDQPIKEASVTRMYDISDIAMPIKDFPGPQLALNADSKAGGGGLFALIADDTDNTLTSDDITDLIKKVVHPEKWSN